MRCEELERRTLLTALPASVETATLDVLAALRDNVRSAITNHVILQTQLPVIGASIADDLDMETILSDGLYDPINTYLAGASTETGLQAALQAIALTSGNITVNVNSAAVSIDNSDISNPLLLISFTLTGTQETEETASYPSGTITIDDSTVTVLHTLNLPVSIQIPFTSGVIADEDVFTNLQAAQITSSVTAYTGATGNIGLLDITISPATFNLNVDLDIQFNDVDGAGNLTLTQLQAGNIADDMTISPVADDMSLNLGVVASLCGSMLGASPQLSLSTSNVFSGSLLSWALNSDLSPVSIFQNMSVADVQGLFNQLATTLNGLADTLNLTDVPWVNESISDIINLGETITQYTSQLQDISGYTFDSFQELSTRLAAYIGVPEIDLDLQCDAAAHAVYYAFDIDRIFTKKVILDMSQDAGPLSIYAGVTADFTATVNIDATIGFDLDPLGGGEFLSDRFFITEGSSISVDAEIDVPDLDMGISIGPVGVCITDGTINFSIGTSISMVDPGTNAADGRVDLGEIIDNPIGDVIDIAAPTIAVAGELPLDGCTSGINTLLGIDTTSSATRPALTLSLGTANDISTFTVTPDAEFNDLIDGLTDFSDLSVWDAVQQVVLFLQSSNIEAFNVTLPLINKSINELVDAAGNFLSMTGGLNINFSTLKTAIEAELGSLDTAISAAAVELATNIVDPDDLNIAQTRLFDLRDAIDSALAQVDLSDLPIRMMSIVGGIDSFTNDYSLDFTTTDLTAAITAIEGLIPSLNSLETRLETMLGLAPSALSLSMEDLGAGNSIVVRLNLTAGFHSTVPLDFSIDGSTIPITIDGAGDLNVDADITLELDFGFNLTTLTPFLLQSSSIGGSADVSTTNLSLTAGLGAVVGVQLGLPGAFGTISLKDKQFASFTGDNSTTNFAVTLTTDQVDLAIVTVDGVVQTSGFTLSTTQLHFTTAPISSADIVVFYPGAGPASVGITLVDNSGSPSDGIINFGDINLSTFNFSGLDGLINARVSVNLPFAGDIGDMRFFMDLSDFDSIYAALPTGIEGALAGEECDYSVWVDGFASLLDTLEAGLESDILQKLPIIGGGLDVAAGFIGQLRGIVGSVQALLDGGLQSAIQGFLYTNLGTILLDSAGDPVDDPSDIDVTVGGAACVEINLHLHGEDTYSADFNLGLDAFILDIVTSGGVDITLDYDVELGIGFSLTEGFYIVTNTDANDPEVEFNISADLALGSNLTASLFFINFKAEEVNDPGTILTGSLDLNLIDPSGSDGHVSISDITSTPFADLLDVSLSGNATVDLLLTADIVANPDLPYVSAVLSVDWDFLGNDGLTGQLPTVSLNDVTFHFGDFLSNILGPIVDQFDDWIAPIKPILDFLNAEIPVISDISEFLGGPSVTVLSLIDLLGVGGDTVDEINHILGLITTITDLAALFSGGNDVSINFGDYHFGQDLRTAGDIDADSAGSLSADGAGSPDDQLDDAAGSDSDLSGLLGHLADVGLDLPIITHPINLIKLLLGQRVDLVTWDIPRLEASFNYEQSFGPLLPPVPLYARIFGSLTVFADFFIGFDTRGFEEGHSILDGFYFGDFDSSGDEVPELGLSATIGAGAELNVVIAKAGVEGGITADLGADWNDVDDDGKVYLDELALQFSQGLQCIFDLSGTLSAFLNFYASLGISTPFGDITLWDKTINLLNIVLFDFTCTCPPLPPPVLAHVSDGSDGFSAGTLVGHIGPFASLRQAGATDGKDKMTVTIATDETTGAPIPGSYVVSAFGLHQTYSGVSRIYIDGGADKDDIRADSTVTVPITLFGGDGDDHLDGGAGPDSISGGDGIDWIHGYDGADILNGDDDGDIIFGGLGNDTFNGGNGADQLYGEEGDDLMYGGDDSDIMYGDAQPNSAGTSTGSGNDVMYGDDGDDVMNGAGGNDNMNGGDGADFIEGIDGNDTAHGDAGNDVINGNLGNDVLYGGDDDDVIRGYSDDTPQGAGADDDQIFGDEGFDDLAGNNGNDFIVGGTQSDAILGGTGNDTILAGWGDDVVHGEDGADYIEGGPDNDAICGQGAIDTIWGGTTVFGFPYIVLGYIDPFTDGGFSQTSCTSPIIFTPPTNNPEDDGTTTISGQKYHDLNGNGVHDPNEPGLDRWKITLYNGSVVVSSQTTYSLDLNGDGTIDPYSESGLYSFEDLAPGTYTVAETMQTGWFQSEPTGPIDPVLGTHAYQIISAGKDSFEDLDFGNYRKGTITGQKFQDTNGNGRQDGNEIFLNDWTIQLYDADNHLVSSFVTLTKPHEDGLLSIGYYEFTNLDPGSYRVVEVLQPGWEQTAAPVGPIEIFSGEVSDHNDFGNRADGSIGGTKWLDSNGDGKRQSTEPGVAGVTIYIDSNNNGQLDPGEQSTITLADDPATSAVETGTYVLTGISHAGTFVVREIVPAGYAETFPLTNGGAWIVTLTASGMVFTTADFGNAPRPGSICGVKFLDKDKDGKRDADEPLLPGWVIYLDLNHNGQRDPGEPVTTTSTDGGYCFNNLQAGQYDVHEQLKTGWSQTAPGKEKIYYTITLTNATVVNGVDFGNVPDKYQGTNGRDNLTIRRGPNDTLDIYNNNDPNQTPVFSRRLIDCEGYTFLLAGGNDSIIIDFSNGSPIPTGMTIDAGTGNDLLRIVSPRDTASGMATGRFSFMINGILIGLSKFNQMEIIGGNADDMLTINGPMDFSPIFRGGGGQNQMVLNDAHYEFPAEFLTDGINLSVEAHGSSELFFTGDQSLNKLIAHELTHVVQQRNGVALRLNQLDIGPNATVDLGESDMILQATTATRQAMYNYLFGQIARARNTGHTPATRWLGNGLGSNAAHLNPGGVTTLGLYQHNQTDLDFLRRFPLDDNSLIVKYTYVGDLDGDGDEDADDYAHLDTGFATRATGYGNGDVNYSGGAPNSDDYFGADLTFSNQGTPINPPPPPTPASVGATASGDIRGNKFWDVNADGVRQTTEVGISGVTIFLDTNNNGIFEPALGEISTSTITDDPATPVNEAGNYSFIGLAFGTYQVREIVPGGFVPTTPLALTVTITTANPIASNINFGNRPANGGSGEIHGNKFSDNDGDGRRGIGESAIPGVVIYLDRDNSGTLTTGDISTVTQNDNPNTTQINETGNYDFFGLPSGTYIVREIVPSGYTQTAPASGSYLVELGQGTVATGRDFANKPTAGAIRGDKFRDLDGDGKRDPNEGGIGGVTIYIDLNGNGQPDAGEPTTITAPDGSWSFPNVPFGTYTIAEVVPPGYAQTAPTGGTFTITFQGQTTFLEFGNRRGEITGTKFEDRDGDGKRGADEPGLAGVTIYLDLNKNTRLDANEPSMQTLSDGSYSFQDLAADTYWVIEIVPAGYTVTIPIGGLGQVDLKAGQTATVNFGNKPDIGISGTKWNDLNGDGRRVQGEPGISGVTIYLDLNNNHQLDAGEPWTVTAADGTYSFHNLNAGIYTVCEVVPDGYAQTFPSANNGCHVVQIGQGVAEGRDFGNSNQPGSIHGTKFNDLNANRKWDAGEPGLPGVTIYVDLNSNGIFDSGEPSAITLTDNPATPAINEAGVYWIYNVPPGTWPVREVVPAGFAQSYPGIALIAADAAGILYDINMNTGAATNPRPTIANLVGISQGLGFTGIHGLTSTGQLVSINEETGAWVLIGTVAAAINEGDLEFDPATGDLYGLYGSGGTLYRINPITGTPTLVGALGTPDPSAMAFDPDGNLYVFDGTAMKIAKINKANGALISAVSISGPNLGPTSGMDFDPLTGTLYLATSGNIGGAAPTLYTLDPTTGALTTIGPTSGHTATTQTIVIRDRNINIVTPGSVTNGVNFGNYQAQILPDGDDSISGGDAADVIHGDNGSGFPAPIVTIGGDDTIWGDADADQIWGQDENDLLYGGDANDLIYGNDGNDTMEGNAGNDTASGGAGDDIYVFTTPTTPTTDIINELFAEGSDWVDMTDVVNAVTFDLNVSSAARSSNLTINLQDGFGGDGSGYMENILGAVTKINNLTGNGADNILFGGNLNDTVTGNLGNNQLFGSDGDDKFIASAGIDVIVSGDIGYDRLDYSGFPVGATVNLQTHSGTHVTSFTDIELFVGSAFSDTLIGANTANTWHITSANAGDVNGAGIIDFTNIENLTGGSAADNFIFSDGASVSGIIDGDGGIDTLNYAAYTTAITVDLTAGSATGTGGVANIENVIGGSGADQITGDNGPNLLVGGLGNNTIGGMDGNDTLVGGANDDLLTGGNGNDLYIITPGGTDTIVEAVGGGSDTVNFALYSTPITADLQGGTATNTTAGSMANVESLVGGSAQDTLIGQDIANVWNITGPDSGNINGTQFYSSFEHLRGGTNTDTFNMLPPGLVSGSIAGGSGADIITYSSRPGPVAANLATHIATSIFNFSGIERLVGSLGSDTLSADNIANNWHLTGLSAGDVNGVGVLDFVSFENLTGGSAADAFIFSDGMGVAGIIDGSGGADTFDYSAYTSAVTVNLQSQTATGTGGFASIENLLGGTVSDTLIAKNTTNTWHITAPNGGDINGTGLLDFASFENLLGGTVADTFVFSNTMGVAGGIDGNGGVDTFDYSAYITGVSVNLQTGIATGVGTTFANLERFIGTTVTDTLAAANVANIWTINAANSGDINGLITFLNFDNLVGGALPDLFRFATGGSIAGSLDGNGAGNTLNYSLRATPVTVMLQPGSATDVSAGFVNIQAFVGSGGSDTLIGRSAANNWHLTSNNAGDIGAPGVLDFASFENLTGNSLVDTFFFSAGVIISGAISGAGGTGDVINYAAYTTPVIVNLPLGAATGVGSVNAIEHITGGSADDILIGTNGVANTLIGGQGNDVLVGNSGADNLAGNDGRDILIGGIGTDTVNGGLGEDIIIGGSTSWDANLANLQNIMSRWLLGGAYSVRITDLKTNAPVLSPGGTVTNDGNADNLTGGGDLDWFLTEGTDTLVDFNTPAGETNDVF